MLLNQACPSPTSCMIPINTFSEIQTFTDVDESTLLLLDIDNTLLSSTIDYGTVEHFSYLCKMEMEENRLSASAAKLANHERWINSQRLIPTKIIDKDAPVFIKEARERQATILAFTARLPGMVDITLQQLARHDLSFDALPDFRFQQTYQVELDISETVSSKEVHALFASGIVFCHDLNTKGDVFQDFFKGFDVYRKAKGMSEINKVIFVDDGAYNFESMNQAMARLGLIFYGFHFQYQNDFDSSRAIAQEKMLIEADQKLRA